MAQEQMQIKPWSSELFSGISEPAVCAQATCCPCVQFAKNKQRMNKTDGLFPDILLYCCAFDFMCCGVTAALGASTRTELRHKRGINGSVYQDFLIHFFCYPFALVQEMREIDYLKNQ